MAGQKVMLDADLAFLYGVKTRRLNAVKRNAQRFRQSFMFRLTDVEAAVTICEIIQRKDSISTTCLHRGGVMLSSVLNSERAIRIGIAVVGSAAQLAGVIDAEGLRSFIGFGLEALDAKPSRPQGSEVARAPRLPRISDRIRNAPFDGQADGPAIGIVEGVNNK